MDLCRDWAGGFGTASTVTKHLPFRLNKNGNRSILYPFLPYSAGVLSRKNCSYSFLDCQHSNLDKRAIIDYIRLKNPRLIISLVSLPSIDSDLELLSQIKTHFPETIMVAVGTVTRFFQNKILKDGGVDLVLRNYYPFSSGIAELLQVTENQDFGQIPGATFIKHGKLVQVPESSETSLNTLCPPSYDGLDVRNYDKFEDMQGNYYSYVPIVGSRGCPFSCSYCPYPLGFGRTCSYRSVESIVAEMEDLKSRGVAGVMFRDQSFLMNKKLAMKICDLLLEKEVKMSWVCESRVDHVSASLLAKMKRAGCKQIHYGVETGAPELIALGKPHASLEIIRKAFRLTKDAGIWRTAHVILGWPDENLQPIEKTLKFIVELSPDTVNWNFLTPYPGTELYKLAKNEGLLLTTVWSKYTSHTIVMRTRFLTANQLQQAATKVFRRYSRIKAINLLHSVNSPKHVLNELRRFIS